MPGAHRNTYARDCGALTIVINQSTVYVNGKLWAVQGDVDSHGDGELTPTGTTVFVEKLPVVVKNDPASTDDEGHSNPKADAVSGDVFAYG